MPLTALIVIASTDRRGAEIEGCELARRLTLNGITSTVVAVSSAGGDNSLDVESLGSRPGNPPSIRRLRKLAKSANVVIAYGSTALPMCAAALLGTGVPFVYRSIGDPTAWSRGMLHRARTSILFSRAARVVALWPAAGRSISTLYRVPQDRIDVVPNARDDSWFRPATAQERVDARAELGLRDRRTVVVVGSLTAEKRVDLAIEAVSELLDVDLIVVGDGPLRAALQEQSALQLPERCRFMGGVAEVREILWAADLLVMCSRTEGIPGALIEAMLVGLPCVATDVGGIRSAFADSPSTAVTAINPTPTLLATEIERHLLTNRPAEMPVSSQLTWAAVVPMWTRILSDVAGQVS